MGEKIKMLGHERVGSDYKSRPALDLAMIIKIGVMRKLSVMRKLDLMRKLSAMESWI